MPTKEKPTPAPAAALDLVGIGEIAERFTGPGADEEVTSQLAHKWTLSKRFPQPRYTLHSGRLWDWAEIKVWAEDFRPELLRRIQPRRKRRK